MHHRPPLITGSLVLLLTGCTTAVKVEPYPAGSDPACEQVAAAWPAVVADLEPRATAVQSTSVAAWGDPPIIARCGAPVPGPTTEQCLDIDGVDWIARELDEGGTQLVTYGRDPAIEVLVPPDYPTAPLLMPAFEEAAQVVPQGDQQCS